MNIARRLNLQVFLIVAREEKYNTVSTLCFGGQRVTYRLHHLLIVLGNKMRLVLVTVHAEERHNTGGISFAIMSSAATWSDPESWK